MRLSTARGRGRRARRAAPLLALAAILAQVGGTVGTYVHFALVSHERCPEHGELVHGQADGESAPQRAAHPRHLDSFEQGGGRTEDSHDACSLIAALRERAVAAGQSAGGRAEPPAAQPLPAPAVEVAAGRADYRIAPKTSPPAIA